jgi:hypothetical protein
MMKLSKLGSFWVDDRQSGCKASLNHLVESRFRNDSYQFIDRCSLKSNQAARSGVILLVVLGSLTFFSILVATFVVFSSESRDTSFALAQQESRGIDVKWAMNESLMTLLRGTSDTTNPFYGEDLLADYYGLHDGYAVTVANGPPPVEDSGFVFIRVTTRTQGNNGSRGPPVFPQVDDVFAGAAITFMEGPLQNRTYRVLRSQYVGNGNSQAWTIGFQFHGDEFNDPNYPDAASLFLKSNSAWINGRPRNSVGWGFRINPTSGIDSFDSAIIDPTKPSLQNLPASLQPNHLLGSNIDKSLIAGDVDEDYDAADYNNWFLSHRNEDGSVIPSFHRPSVINYLLKYRSDYPTLLRSIERATFRPLPVLGRNQGFKGGSSEYALRAGAPIGTNPARLNQLVDALVNGQWDVDNDSDGVADSVWIDLGLPAVTAPDGRILRPLIAPMIEDLGARLNLNAHGNLQSESSVAQAGSIGDATASWAGQPNTPRALFKGLGWGPAEIALPDNTGKNLGNLLNDLINSRYESSVAAKTTDPGTAGRDSLDVLTTGKLPRYHTASGGWGSPQDVFGQSSVGVGRSGHLLVVPPSLAAPARQDLNHPYELDASGRLSGDATFTMSDLEALLRSDDFDTELLPDRLRDKLAQLVQQHPSYRHAFSTLGASEDSPIVSLLDLTLLASLGAGHGNGNANGNGVGNVNRPWLDKIIPPELRLGRKVDVNRAVGNGVDDDGDLIIDEPSEVLIEETPSAQGKAFAVGKNSAGTLPAGFDNITPSYTWDEGPGGGNQFPVTGRQLLARHLYLIAMLVRYELDLQPPYDKGVLPTHSNYNQNELEAYTARRLAQWAVNVVDYRDPDAIMTRFEFDPDPFNSNGWSVQSNNPNQANVVWGVEEPQLVFSESLAFHDVRVRDTDQDSSGEFKKQSQNAADVTTDQVRIPQGSLFLELFCPQPPINSSLAADETTKSGRAMEFYTQAPTGDLQLNLAATAPPRNNAAPYGAPVWRIAISERHDQNAGIQASAVDAAPSRQRLALPDTASFELDQPDEIQGILPNGNRPLEMTRFVLFTNIPEMDTNPQAAFNQIRSLVNGNQISDMSPEQVFVAPSLSSNAAVNSDRLLEPGQFLVLAPRLSTHFGSSFDFSNATGNAGGNTTGNTFNLTNQLSPSGPSSQAIRLEPVQGFLQLGHYGVLDSDSNGLGNRVTPQLSVAGQGAAYGARALPLVISAPRRNGWNATTSENGVVGLNISEPMPNANQYYPQPTLRYFGNTAFPDGGSYPLTDAYLDFSDVNDTAINDPVDEAFDLIPFGTEGDPELGTIENYRTAYLQRLADPTLPYDEQTNPYRTVDWMQLDLTVFSGEEREDFVTENEQNDYARRSRQRNGHVRLPSDLSTVVPANTLYSYETVSDNGRFNMDVGAYSVGASGQFFQFESQFPGDDGKLLSSLSFLNCKHPTANPGQANFGMPFEGYDLPLGTLVTGMDANFPRTPYALHPWLNRDFATPFELMMVPACSASRLFEEFTVCVNDPTVYPTDNRSVAISQSPYRHLLNFFHSNLNVDGNLAGDPGSLELARIFEFVHTLPRYRGEVEYLVPGRSASISNRVNNWTGFADLIKPPFNFLYNNQRQGTINLNSVSSFPVWAGLMQGHMSVDEYTDSSSTQSMGFKTFLDNRRGYLNDQAVTKISSSTLDTDPVNYRNDLHPDLPTRFAGLYRSPLLAGKSILPDLDRPAVNSTLFRDQTLVTSTVPTQKPFFVRGVAELPVVNPVDPSVNPASNRLRNPFMRYQTLMRMPNLVSNNSQVFLIRMTMGFFEVDADSGELGDEYRANEGMSERFKGTFVIDRSIPVGYQPGVDLNTRDVVIFESLD